MQLCEFETVDYAPTTSMTERNWTAWVVRKFLGGLPFALDFGDGDIRPMSDQTYEIMWAPPRFRTLLFMLTNPSLKFGETFMDGKWYCSQGKLSDFVEMLLSQKGATAKGNGLSFGATSILTHIYKQFLATFSATRKVARHYDISAEFFSLVIGLDLVYSCAFFEDNINDLGEAQQRKFDRIFERMEMPSARNLKVLDIGCGWGSFERYFPRDLQAKVDAISISKKQISFARRKYGGTSNAANVEVEFFEEDYRHYCKRKANYYNRVVSIGMLEHVGKSKFGHYFNAISNVLTDDGIALVHSIVKKSDQVTNIWFDRYIFPGGYVPKISEVMDGIEKAGLKVQCVHIHSGTNYIETLNVWLHNLLVQEKECLRVLIDEQHTDTEKNPERVARTTMRMFVFYLAAVQSSFHPSLNGDRIAHFIVTH